MRPFNRVLDSDISADMRSASEEAAQFGVKVMFTMGAQQTSEGRRTDGVSWPGTNGEILVRANSRKHSWDQILKQELLHIAVNFLCGNNVLV